MKNLLKQPEVHTSLFKFDLKMRMSVLLLLTGMFALQASDSYSQRTKVTLNLENITVERLIDVIEDKTEFRFLYLLEDVNLKRIVSVKAKRERVNSVLDRVFLNTETTYQIDDKQISLVKRGKPAIEAKELPQSTVEGTVFDEFGAPLLGANVIVKGTSTGVVTDFDGKYTIQAQPGQTLVFSYVGMKDQEVVVGNNPVINVVLKEDVASLQEVVVEGYRTVAKEKSVIAGVTVTSEALEARPNASFVQSLSGQIAGVDIQTGSGQPGANSLIQIRGVSSINGNTEPLFLMDGIPINEDNFRSLNPNDIESISVIKDAAGSSIFGSRGANGVIVIKTKKGAKGSPLRIDYTGIQSFSSIQGNDYNLMSAQDYLRLERQLGIGRGNELFTDEAIDAAPDTDWMDFFLRTGTIENHTLSLTQGGENSATYTSLGYFNQEGILKNTGLQRFTFRNNLNGNSGNGKFNYTANITANYSKNDQVDDIGSTGVLTNNFYGAFSSIPYFTPEEYLGGQDLYDKGFNLRYVPLYIMDRLNTLTFLEEELKIVASFSADYELAKNLRARIVFGGDYESTTVLFSQAPEAYWSLLLADGRSDGGFQDQSSIRDFAFTSTTSLNYNKSFGRHSLDATVAMDYFKAHSRFFAYTANGLDSRNFSPGDGSGFIPDNSSNDFFVDTVGANKLDAGLFSYFGNLDYDYDTRYGISATLRRDASYRFATTNRWGTFYSIGARWNISNESFMEGSAFNELKLRASYGTSGNQRISGNDYFSAADLPFSFYGTGRGYGGANAIFSTQIGNSTLRWEEVTQGNIGLDFGVFRNRLRGSVDVYDKKTSGLFQLRPISLINAQSAISANVGDMTNKGVDLTLQYDVMRKEGLSLTINLVGNYNENELSNLPSESGEILGIGRNGGRISEYKLIRYAGVNPGNGNLLFLDIDGNLTENPDFDRDAVWTNKNATPDATGSFGFNFNYKGFYLDTQWNYVIGVDRFDFVYQGYTNVNRVGALQLSRDILNAWTPDNRITDIPGFNATNLGVISLGTSDRFLRSADYLRLRFLNIGYQFSNEFLKGTGLKKLKLFGSAENLVTFSEWRGFDAEARSGTRVYPTPRILSFGIELGL